MVELLWFELRLLEWLLLLFVWISLDYDWVDDNELINSDLDYSDCMIECNYIFYFIRFCI